MGIYYKLLNGDDEEKKLIVSDLVAVQSQQNLAKKKHFKEVQ